MSAGGLGRKRAAICAVIAVTCLVLSLPAAAQAPAGTAIPGTTREEIAPDRTPDRVLVPDVSVPGVVGDDEPVAPPETQMTFRLNGVNLTGATAYDREEFDEILQDFLGKDVSLGSLREIGNRIERKYREDGYVATRVIIPPQAIQDGVPRLEIYEGKIIHYEINGEIGPVKERIALYLDNLLTDEPARWEELERYLLISRDLPGISLTGTLRSAGDSTPGGVILVVDAARKPVDGYVNVQNRNAAATGPWTLSGGASFNSNTKWGERLGFVGLVSLQEFEPIVDDRPFEQVSTYFIFETAIGDEGLRLKISNTNGFAKPGDELFETKLETDTTVFRVELNYPAVRSRRFSMWTRGGFDTADQRAVIAEQGLFDDQVRTLFLGLQGVWFAPFGGITEFDFELRKGLDHFGAPKYLGDDVGRRADARSRGDAEFDFTVVEATVSHRQPVLTYFEFFVEASGQLSSAALPSIEEWVLGTLTVGRGFEPGAITGDSGFGVVLEARYSPPGVDLWWLDNLQFYGFLDYGRAYDIGNPTDSPKGFEELASFGFGTRFQVFESVFGDVYLAIPQTRALSTSADRPNPTVHMTLTKFF